MRWPLLLEPLLIVAGVAACEPATDLEPSRVIVETGERTVELSVQVADTPEERAAGLTHREDLEPYDGMAFVWSEPTTPTFTMRDTLIPLSIAFWNERGRIVSILQMEPCRVDDCPSYRARGPVVGALEVEQGRFGQEGIGVGDRVELVAAET